MASDGSQSLPSVILVCGDDEYAVKQRGRQIYQQWSGASGDFDHEIIDASAANSAEAIGGLAKLSEALQTLPLFSSNKVVWFQNCNFLGDERTAAASAVTEALSDLAQELKRFAWHNVRLLITAGKVDKRRTIFKTLETIGVVENFAAWSLDDRNWTIEAEHAAERQLHGLKKEISPEALAKLITSVGPNARQLGNEIEKVALYAAERPRIDVEDVEAVVSRNKQSRAFALADALGERNLPRLLRILDEELWEVKTSSQKTEIGLLYGLIAKIRVMLLLKELAREGWLKPVADFNRFKTQLERIPSAALPEDRRFNPLAMNPYVLFKAWAHAKEYSSDELVKAMEELLECNHRLIFSDMDEAFVLQQALVKIANRPTGIAN